MNENKALRYDPIAMSEASTVVSVYEPGPRTAEDYQSEAQLEREFIQILQSQAYEYLAIHSEEDLIANLRFQLEGLNKVSFSDEEWKRFFSDFISTKNDTVEDKTIRFQENEVYDLELDDGTIKNVRLIDKHNVHNNRLQVINQYEVGQGEGGAQHNNRYDVTILVNGLPIVHVELKRRGVEIREAFNQIRRYQRESFWAGSGLFDYVQIFVISNGTHTKYYSNTARLQHIGDRKLANRKNTSNSFEFTSWWADANNKPISDLTAFAKTFFAKHSLLNVLTKYCVLTAGNPRLLLVMRPYQIVATERILQRIVTSFNAGKVGTLAAGGYIWHTTGSGKTLTSFKTAQLATKIPGIHKVLFVVDRKDLDYQTVLEYDRFQKGAANSNTSTAQLKRQLEDPEARIIVTTIQKLATFVRGNQAGHRAFTDHTAIIFDECHRSQFGDMHKQIRKFFKNYHLFGFTGTPIFAANQSSGGDVSLRTTEQAFGEKLHTYTIVDAINDKNVLPFRIDHLNTIKSKDIEDAQVSAIERESALLADDRLSKVVAYILEHFPQKTKRGAGYELRGRRVRGFNALFATASIKAAMAYYAEFERQQKQLVPDKRLTVGLIYSYAPNPDSDEAVNGLLGEEGFDTEQLPDNAKDFLAKAINDYNQTFGTNYGVDSARFENYYKDLSRRIKEREIDLVIVVNMFLTGFDATTLNTLFVDKNLKAHGLIQAFSRTNRILNSVKTYGNIVSFRDLEQQTQDAIALFGNKDARGIVLLKPYAEYHDEYRKKVNDLTSLFPVDQVIVGEQNKKDFIALFGAITRLLNILTSFDQFADDRTLPDRDLQDYRSKYLDLYREFRQNGEGDQEPIQDDVVFEIELIKQVEINVDYILMLVEKYRKERGDGDDIEIKIEISRAVNASPSLRSKKDLIEQFIDSVSTSGDIADEWNAYIQAKKEHELKALIKEENLKPEQTEELIESAFRDGALNISGTAITRVMPPMSRFTPNGERRTRKQLITRELKVFFERFFGLSTNPTRDRE